jgi:regulator of protease activity HflC (stomatin/prohibitin superfamily)
VLRQYERGVVFLLGKFADARGPGLTLIFVPIQQMVRVSLRTVTMQIPSQKIITKDNVSIDIAAVAYYHISDPEKADNLGASVELRLSKLAHFSWPQSNWPATQNRHGRDLPRMPPGVRLLR